MRTGRNPQLLNRLKKLPNAVLQCLHQRFCRDKLLNKYRPLPDNIAGVTATNRSSFSADTNEHEKFPDTLLARLR